MRMEYVWPAGRDEDEELAADFARDVAEPFGMDWRIAPSEPPKRMAILVSREEHCLLDLLWRRRRGELPAEIAVVVSNHETAAEDVAGFGIPFRHIPVPPGKKAAAEKELAAELQRHNVEVVVLARYMQILSGMLLDRLALPVINIHHSFLPAFVGADPYHRAVERGVKIIGATAHYVTEELDAGPIIEQDVERVDHRHTVEELTEVGRDIERRVLARAVRWHLEDRVLVYDGRTVVF